MPEESYMVVLSLQEEEMAAETVSAGWPKSQATLKSAALIRTVLHSICPRGDCRLCLPSS